MVNTFGSSLGEFHRCDGIAAKVIHQALLQRSRKVRKINLIDGYFEENWRLQSICCS
ncbi:MAG: hypothetical protein AB1861_23545 [Cyanobacteriota bacterium]